MNFAKDSFLLRVSVNTKPFSGVINFNIPTIMSNLDFNLFDYSSNMTDTVSLTGMWEDLLLLCPVFHLEFLCPVLKE